MKLELEVKPIPHFPAPEGGHELAWSYIFDLIFGHAYQANVGRLKMVLPHEGLVKGAELRASLCLPNQARTAEQTGLAWLSDRFVVESAQRVFVLRYGRLAPRHLRQLVAPQFGRLEASYQVYTLGAMLAGLGMRAGSLHSDRAWLMLRRQFASERKVPSYYRLELRAAL
jgi:hypothetical protein